MECEVLEMSKRVLDVGNCGFDHGSIKSLIEANFDAEVIQAHDLDEAISQLDDSDFDLTLVNRVFDRNGESGLDLIRRITDGSNIRSTPVMLISNFANYQDEAVKLDAVRGFGKSQLNEKATLDKLRVHLG